MHRTISVFLLLSAFTTSGWCDGLIRDGLGARSAGRGGSNIAWADDGTILHDNVAGLVNLDSCWIVEGGPDFLVSDVEYSEAAGEGDYRQDLVPLGNIAFAKKITSDIAWGIGAFSTGGFAAKTVIPGPPPFTGDRTYKSFGALVRILPGVSLRMTERWSVGATLGVAASHVELEGPYTLQTGVLQSTPTLLDVQGNGAALSWSVGSQYQLSSRTTLGINFQSENRFELDGHAKTTVPGIGESSFDSTIEMVWPRSVGAGLRHEFSPSNVGSIDLIYYNWQRSFDDVGLLLSNATNPIVATFGPLEDRLPLNWRDTLSVRLGYERTLRNTDTLRMGYVYHRNPIPSSTLTTYISPTLEHTFSIGYGSQYRGLNIDVGYQFMYGDSVDIGTSDLIGGDFSNSTMQTAAHFFYVSFGLRGSQPL